MPCTQSMRTEKIVVWRLGFASSYNGIWRDINLTNLNVLRTERVTRYPWSPCPSPSHQQQTSQHRLGVERFVHKIFQRPIWSFSINFVVRIIKVKCNFILYLLPKLYIPVIIMRKQWTLVMAPDENDHSSETQWLGLIGKSYANDFCICGNW